MVFLGASDGLDPGLTVDLGLHFLGSLRDGFGIGGGPCEEVAHRSVQEWLQAFTNDFCRLKGTLCAGVEYSFMPGTDEGCAFSQDSTRCRVCGGGIDLGRQPKVPERGPPAEEIGAMSEMFFKEAYAFLETTLDHR